MWRVRLRGPDTDRTAAVDDSAGTARLLPAALAGDAAVACTDWIHEGWRGGPVWATIVFLTGVFPLVFLVTGVTMWLRRPPGKAGRVIGRPTGRAP